MFFDEVSIIIPTYGGSNSLERVVDSALSGQDGDYDVIVVDDNNPDSEGRKKTERIMEKYIGMDSVIYLKHEKNKNGSAARNTGANFSDSKYLCFIDDDDIVLPGRISKQKLFMDSHSEYKGSYCWCILDGKEVRNSEVGDLTKSLLDQSFSPQTSTWMIDHEAFDSINGFDESYRRHQDYEFLLRFFKLYKFGVVKEVLLKRDKNEIDNQLHGAKLVEMKKYLFDKFGYIVDEIDKKDIGYKKRVYAKHFANTCFQLLKDRELKLAIETFNAYGRKGGLLFWKHFLKRINVSIRNVLRHQ